MLAGPIGNASPLGNVRQTSPSVDSANASVVSAAGTVASASVTTSDIPKKKKGKKRLAEKLVPVLTKKFDEHARFDVFDFIQYKTQLKIVSYFAADSTDVHLLGASSISGSSPSKSSARKASKEAKAAEAATMIKTHHTFPASSDRVLVKRKLTQADMTQFAAENPTIKSTKRARAMLKAKRLIEEFLERHPEIPVEKSHKRAVTIKAEERHSIEKALGVISNVNVSEGSPESEKDTPKSTQLINGATKAASAVLSEARSKLQNSPKIVEEKTSNGSVSKASPVVSQAKGKDQSAVLSPQLKKKSPSPPEKAGLMSTPIVKKIVLPQKSATAMKKTPSPTSQSSNKGSLSVPARVHKVHPILPQQLQSPLPTQQPQQASQAIDHVTAINNWIRKNYSKLPTAQKQLVNMQLQYLNNLKKTAFQNTAFILSPQHVNNLNNLAFLNAHYNNFNRNFTSYINVPAYNVDVNQVNQVNLQLIQALQQQQQQQQQQRSFTVQLPLTFPMNGQPSPTNSSNATSSKKDGGNAGTS